MPAGIEIERFGDCSFRNRTLRGKEAIHFFACICIVMEEADASAGQDIALQLIAVQIPKQ